MRLIRFAPVHFPTLQAWFGNEREVVQWGGPAVSHPLDGGQLQRMVEEGKSDPPTRLCWMAQEQAALVGHAQLAFDWRNGNSTLGRVAIAPERRGTGLAGPMLQLVAAEAFSWPSIERLELNVHAWNSPAIRSYQRLGFEIEGCRRSSTRVACERWDTMIMAMLRPEWERLRPHRPVAGRQRPHKNKLTHRH